MAVKTYRLASTLVNNFGELLEADQTVATLATGWVVAKLASPQSSEMDVGTEVASGTFSSNSTTAKPASLITGTTANALRTSTPLSGQFANTNWSIAVVLRSVTAAGGTVRIRCRVYKSANADGSGATELTGSTQVGTTTGALSTSADQTSTVTWAPGGTITLTNEYLFFAIALEVVTAGGSNSSDADIRAGTSANGTRVVTPDFSVIYSDTGTVRLSFTPSAVETAEFVDSGTVPLYLKLLSGSFFDGFDTSPARLSTPGGTITGGKLTKTLGAGGSSLHAALTQAHHFDGDFEIKAEFPDRLARGGATYTTRQVCGTASDFGQGYMYLEYQSDVTDPNGRYRFVLIATTGTISITASSVNEDPPRWMRVRRVGDDYYWDKSDDGVSWTQLHTVNSTARFGRTVLDVFHQTTGGSAPGSLFVSIDNVEVIVSGLGDVLVGSDGVTVAGTGLQFNALEHTPPVLGFQPTGMVQKFTLATDAILNRIRIMLGKTGSPSDQFSLGIWSMSGNTFVTSFYSQTVPNAGLSVDSLTEQEFFPNVYLPAGEYGILNGRSSVTEDDSNTYLIGVLTTVNRIADKYSNIASGFVLTTDYGYDQSFLIDLVRQTDLIYLDLTPGGTDEYTPAPAGTEYTDSGTVRLSFTPSGTEEHTTFDSGTITLAFTPSGTDQYSVTYTDSGTVYLTLTPGGLVLFNQPILDDFTYNDSVVNPANWSGDAWGGVNTLRQNNTNDTATTSPGSYITGWWKNETFGPDTEVAATIAALPVTDQAVWLEARTIEPGTGNHDCYHLEWYRRSGTDQVRAFLVINNSQFGGNLIDVNEEMQVGSQLGLRVTGSNPVVIQAYVKHPGGEWTLIGSAEDPSASRITAAGYVTLGIGSSAAAEVDDFRAGTIVAAPGDTAQFVDSGTIYLTLTPGTAAGADYDTEVLADSPSFYWKLDEAFGIAVRDHVNVFSDQEIYATITHYSDVNNLKGIQFFLHDDGAGNGYRCSLTNDSTSGTNDAWSIERLDGGTPTLLNFGSVTNYAEDDIVGATSIAGTIYLWRHRAGVTTVIGQHSDSTHEEGDQGYNIISPSDFDFDDITNHMLGYAGRLVNTPTLDQPPLRTDGSSIHLNNGQDEYINLTPIGYGPTSYNGGIAVEIWMKPDAAPLDVGIFGSWVSGDSGGPMIWCDHLTGNLRGVWNLAGVASYLDAGFVPDEDEVYHVVLNYDAIAERLSLWVNGEELDFVTGITTLGGSDAWAIGRYNNSDVTCFAGWVQNAAIYPGPLTGERIAAHYDAGLGLGGPGETAQFVDSATITLTFTPSGVDEYEGAAGGETTDSGTITLLLVPSVAEVFAAVDTGTISLVFTPSGTELREIVDTGTALVTLSPSGTDVQVFAESATLRLELTPSGTEFQTREYADSNTITVAFTPSGAEQAAYVDSAETYLTFTASGTEIQQAVEVATVDLRLTPGGTEEYTGVSHYVDAGTALLVFTVSLAEAYTTVDSGQLRLSLTPGGTDLQERVFTDSATATLSLVPSGIEYSEYVDSATASLTFTPSGSDTLETTTATVVTLQLTPSGVDEYDQIGEFEDSGTVYLHLTPISTTLTGMQLSSRAFIRYRSRIMGRWASRSFKRVLSRL